MKFGWKKTLVGLMAGLAVVGAAFTAYGAVSISTVHSLNVIFSNNGGE